MTAMTPSEINDSSDEKTIHRERTSNRTSLGLVLQGLVEVALRNEGIGFEPNARYYESFIRPDVLIPGLPPRISVHVTATGGDDNFRKKKWRYIDEVLQMRSVWKGDFLSVNLLFGPLTSYQSGDLTLMRTLFDKEVAVDQLDGGSDLYECCLETIMGLTSKVTCKELVCQLTSNDRVRDGLRTLGECLRAIQSGSVTTKHKKSEIDLLSLQLKQREKLLASSKISKSGEAYWKRTVLRFLTISPAYWETIFSIGVGEVAASELPPDFLVQARRSRLVEIAPGLIDRVRLAKDVGLTIRAGLTVDFVCSIANTVHANPRRRYELDDLWDGGIRAKASIMEVAQAVAQGNGAVHSMVVHALREGGSIEVTHHRAHVIDVLLAAVGLSLSQVQERYGGPGIGVVDPIRNLVPRTDIAVQAISSGSFDVDACSQSILEVLGSSIDQVDWTNVDKISESYLTRRAQAIASGSSIDPLEEYVRLNIEAHGWALSKPTFQHKSSFIGKVKLDFDVVAEKDGKMLLVKCLFGDSGADHKAEEMEARIRLFRLFPPADKQVISVFVADGKWSSNNLKSLFLGGWDHIVGVSDFPAIVSLL